MVHLRWLISIVKFTGIYYFIIRHNSLWLNLLGAGTQIHRCKSENSLIDNSQTSEDEKFSDQLQSQSTTAMSLPKKYKPNFRSNSITVTDIPPGHILAHGAIGIGEQQYSDVDNMDSSNSSPSSISSSPSSQPNEDLIQVSNSIYY